MSDEIALQKLFPALIAESKKNVDLQLDVKSKNDKGETVVTKKSLFSVYSHDGYAALNKGTQVNAMIGGKPQAVSTNSDVEATSKFDASQSEFFTDSTTDGFAGFKTKKTINIVFIPSNDPALVTTATATLQKFLSNHQINSTITVSDNYNIAATQLANNQIDVAFLPVET